MRLRRRCAVPDSNTLAAIEHKLGSVHARRRAWTSAEAHFAAALDVAGAVAGRTAASRILADSGAWPPTRKGRRIEP